MRSWRSEIFDIWLDWIWFLPIVLWVCQIDDFCVEIWNSSNLSQLDVQIVNSKIINRGIVIVDFSVFSYIVLRLSVEKDMEFTLGRTCFDWITAFCWDTKHTDENLAARCSKDYIWTALWITTWILLVSVSCFDNKSVWSYSHWNCIIFSVIEVREIVWRIPWNYHIWISSERC